MYDAVHFYNADFRHITLKRRFVQIRLQRSINIMFMSVYPLCQVTQCLLAEQNGFCGIGMKKISLLLYKFCNIHGFHRSFSNRLFENSIYRFQASYNKVEICFDFIFCSDYNFNHTMQRNLSNCVLESIILGGSTMQSILPGMYRHYKGNHYQVLYLAKHS